MGYGTWYRSAFPDDHEPRLVFLVHSDERRTKVQRAVKERLGMLPPGQFRVLVMTFAEAPSLLVRYVREGVAEPARPRRERIVRVDEAVLEEVAQRLQRARGRPEGLSSGHHRPQPAGRPATRAPGRRPGTPSAPCGAS